MRIRSVPTLNPNDPEAFHENARSFRVLSTIAPMSTHTSLQSHMCTPYGPSIDAKRTQESRERGDLQSSVVYACASIYRGTTQ